ncbi:TIGR02452 family protein [Flavobacterium sp. HNIBRBA15423]|uniref:TIGR02452 family protein n=1 Tax=Flavobacterium sp. HNIBRBA15423 TaxID=3458683 RepID=UPI004043C37C
MNKNSRLAIAQSTVQIIDDGFYYVNNEKKDVNFQIKNNIEKTFTIALEEWSAIMSKPIIENKESAEIVVKNCSTMEAMFYENNTTIAILNFASAKNPGGGFLGGASAQEESLARSSSLYASLTKDKTMYEYNKNQRSFLYSDYMIYSPATLFWFNDEGHTLTNEIVVDVITSPAPNKGAMLQQNRTEEIAQIEEVFIKRIEHVLHIANQQKIETLILGAWGCGVFRNEPKEVATLFRKVIEEKYAKAFKKIVFAIRDSSEKKQVLKAFEEIVS